MPRKILPRAAAIFATSALALDGDIIIHDPATVIAQGGRYYTYGTGNGSVTDRQRMTRVSRTASFNQPVSYKNPAALALPATYVAFIPKDKSADERAKTDKSWRRAVARGSTIKTFPGTHVAMTEDPRGVATLIEESVNDVNKPASKAAK